MDSPFNYSVSSFVVSNINSGNESDDELESRSNSNEQDEFNSEISTQTDEPTDADFSMNDSDYEDYSPEISAEADGDSFIHDSIGENDTSENSVQIESDHESEEEPVEPTAKKIKLDNELAEESDGNESVDPSQKCPICLGAWTTTGKHRLCSLRCGHIFGYKCIKQWLNSDNESAKRCPQCNAPAAIRHIRFLYANKVISIDSSEIERFKKQINKNNHKISKLLKVLHKQKKRTRKYKKLCNNLTLTATMDSDFCFSD